jgi:prepilin-type N-terminal cleavage/methylation domain-containing protein
MKERQSGFTLIELLVVIAIFAILASLALFFSMDFFRTYSRNSEHTTLVSALSKARAQSMANMDRMKHGVKIEPSGYTIFKGDTFDPANIYLTIEVNSDTKPSGNYQIVFDQLTGNTAPATITFTNSTKTVSVNTEGAILW